LQAPLHKGLFFRLSKVQLHSPKSHLHFISIAKVTYSAGNF
jgi:hypothetical protein